MARSTLFRVALLVIAFLGLAGLAYLAAKPGYYTERATRAYLVDHLSEWTGASVSIEGPVRLSYFPRLVVETGRIRIAGTDRLPGVKAIEARGVEIRLGLLSLVSDTPVVDRVTLFAPEITASSTWPARPAPPGAEAPPALVAAVEAAPFDRIVTENGRIVVTGAERNEEFTEVNLKLDPPRSGNSHEAKGSFTWRGQAISFSYEGGSVQQVANAAKLPVTLHVSSDVISGGISGEATVSDTIAVSGDLNLSIPNLPRFARWTGVLVPENQKSGDFSASGTVHWAGRRIGFEEGSFELDGNKAIGTLALNLAGPRPDIEGTLALQRLDLTQYFESAEPAKPAPDKPESQPAGQKAVDVDLPLLHHFNADLRISTTELLAAPVRLGQSALSVTLNAGKLAADIAVFELCGGNGTGRLEIDATVPRSAVRFTGRMNDISAQRCIEIFTPDSPVEGIAGIAADVTSDGRTANELLKSLGGKVTVSLAAGQTTLSVAKLVAAVRNGPVLGWNAASGPATAFRQLHGDFYFRHGGVYTDSLKIDLGTKDLSGEGTLDLVERALDLRMELSERPPGEEAPGAQASTGQPPGNELPPEEKNAPHIAGVIVIKGPWSQPRFSLEPPKSSARAAPFRDRPQTARWGNY